MPQTENQDESGLNIFDVPIDRLSWAELDEYCRKALLEDTPRHIVTANGEILLQAADDKNYANILRRADLVIAESTNVALVARWKGRPVREVTAGADLVNHIAEVAINNQKSIFLLGSREGIAAKAGERLQQLHQGLKISGCSSADPNDPDILKYIKDSGADILLVAYGSPKQEQWIAEHKDELGAKILVGIGGTFDMLAGAMPRAPLWVRKFRLEWLWRVILQPSRFARIWRAVVVFPLKAIFE